MLTRRNLIASLVGLPVFAGVKVAASVEPAVQADDLVVIEYPGLLSTSSEHAIRAQIERILPPQARCVILHDGMKLRVERGIAKAEPAREMVR